MAVRPISLVTAALECVFQIAGERLSLERYGSAGRSWLHPSSPSGLFAVYADGKRLDAHSLPIEAVRADRLVEGFQDCRATFQAPDLQIEHRVRLYDDTALLELGLRVRNTGGQSIRLTRLDSLSLDIPAGDYELLRFASDWGQEFEPVRLPLTGAVTLETRFGRSSKGMHPWFALFAPDGQILSGSVAWSGNWIMRFEPLVGGGYRLSGGLSDWAFFKDLQPGQAVEAPPALLVLGGSLDAVAQQYALVGRRHWTPRNRLSAAAPVEWNPWWSYEDSAINDEVFRRNARAAAGMGIELCTLDAGWFGPGGAHWHDYRGDWDWVNTERFPAGIRPLADETHASGLKFGLWCEIEGLGARARLTETRPDFAATRAGQPLGYVCFGNPAAREWAYQTLCRLIIDDACDWIKLDFNVDPGAGCDRVDHGHGAGDGLYEHVNGYYGVLERVRRAFPEVVLENCSSGGLRIDLGMLRRTHLTFLSDPDGPVHALQVFWGASLMLAPDACLHWSFSEWLNPAPHQTFDPHAPDLTPERLDYYTRIGMLGLCGFSQRLPDLPAWVAARLAQHAAIYKNHVRRFVGQADLYRLTGQPLRGGGDRWAAFQYSLPDEHLLFVFRLPGGEPVRAIRLRALDPERSYTVAALEGGAPESFGGRELMERGLVFAHLQEEESALLHITAEI